MVTHKPCVGSRKRSTSLSMDYSLVRQLKGLSLRKAVGEGLGYRFVSTNGGYFVLIDPNNHPHGTYKQTDWEYAPAFELDISDAMPIAEKYHYALIPWGDKWCAFPENELKSCLVDACLAELSDTPAEAICRCFLLKEVRQ